MRRLAVPTWTTIVIMIAGLWAAVIPFVWPAISSLLNPAPMSAMHSGSAMNMTTLSTSVFFYHIVPGGVAFLVGLYQLTAAHLRASQHVPAATDTDLRGAQAAQ